MNKETSRPTQELRSRIGLLILSPIWLPCIPIAWAAGMIWPVIQGAFAEGKDDAYRIKL